MSVIQKLRFCDPYILTDKNAVFVKPVTSLNLLLLRITDITDTTDITKGDVTGVGFSLEGDVRRRFTDLLTKGHTPLYKKPT